MSGQREIFYPFLNNGRMNKERGIMPEITHLTSLKEESLKTAVENTCELCHDYFPSSLLAVHLISRRLTKEMKRDPSTGILVVCGLCHAHIHRLPVSVVKQRALVRNRSFYIRRDVRRIMGYIPKPYQAPDDIDLFVILEENFGHGSPGPYRISG
jgi:hypothetical protein